MSKKVIVLVSDRDDPKHGEISVLEDDRKAERLVETLLQAGFEQERIRIFAGNEMDMQVTHKPIVALVGNGTLPDSPKEVLAEEEAPSEEDDSEVETDEEESPGETIKLHSQEEQESTPAVAYYQGGVRFSSLFRSA